MSEFFFDYEKTLAFIKGVTDSNGLTESVNAIAGSEVIFSILSDDYKKLAKVSGIKKGAKLQKLLLTRLKKECAICNCEEIWCIG